METNEEENLDILSPEQFDFIQRIADGSIELDSDINRINSLLEQSVANPINDIKFSSLNYQVMNIMKRIDEEIHKTKDLISNIQNEANYQIKSANYASMVSSKHRKMFEDYVNRELEVVSIPYPPLCGAIPPNPEQPLPVGSFVAAKVESENKGESIYILCYVQGVIDDKYIIADATLADPSINFIIDQSEVIPMPTSLPDIKTKDTEYPSGAKVLSLWPEENIWTSVFYSASVVKSPSETGHSYKLIFDGDEKSTFVPEKYVIPHP